MTVRVVKQDYSKCLNVSLEGAESNVLNIYRDESFPLKIKLKPDLICANVIIKSIIWA